MAKECTCQGPRPHSPRLSYPVTCCQPRLDGDCGSQSLGLWGRGPGGDLYLPGEGREFRGSEEAPRTPSPHSPTSMKLAESHGLCQTWVKGVRKAWGPVATTLSPREVLRLLGKGAAIPWPPGVHHCPELVLRKPLGIIRGQRPRAPHFLGLQDTGLAKQQPSQSDIYGGNRAREGLESTE